jgi:hypothetical protein
MTPFIAKIAIVGINPYVLVPAGERKALFSAAGRDKGPIPVEGTLDGVPFKQTLVRFKGRWRLYVNGPLLRATNKAVGDAVRVELRFDAMPRQEEMHPGLLRALRKHGATAAFGKLAPSQKKEILRYLNKLKGSEAIARNIESVVAHLTGNGTQQAPAFLRPTKRGGTASS